MIESFRLRSPGPGIAIVLAALTVLGLLVGCEDASVGSEPSPTGLWTLVAVGGEELPVFYTEQDEIVAGELVIQEGGIAHQSLEVRGADTDADTQQFVWSWTRTSNTLDMERTDGIRATAHLEGGTLGMFPENFHRLAFER